MGANKHPPNQSQRLESLRPSLHSRSWARPLSTSGLRLCERGERDLERQEVRPGGELAREEQQNSAAPPPQHFSRKGERQGRTPAFPPSRSSELSRPPGPWLGPRPGATGMPVSRECEGHSTPLRELFPLPLMDDSDPLYNQTKPIIISLW